MTIGSWDASRFSGRVRGSSPGGVVHGGRSMRLTAPRRGWVLGGLVVVAALALVGAGSPKKKRPEPPPPKVDETIMDLAFIKAKDEIHVEGIGLVSGLDDTGVEPPPGWYRQKLVDEMRKAGVEASNQILKDKRFSLVLVKAKIPSGVTPADRLDVEISLPPGSGTTSLAGGFLMETRLREILVAGGTPKEGSDLAMAQGPVMTGNQATPDNLKVGRVLGAARVKKPLPFTLVIKESRRSFKTSALLQSVVNQRFHFAEGVNEAGASTAKSDQYLELKVPRVYHHNQDRYFRVIQLLQMIDTPELREQRQQAWEQELLDPKTAGVAALRLEGLGITAVESLKKGLENSNSQVRFFAAEALAYLNDASGVDVLSESSIHQKEFRGYALAALGALDQAAAHMSLRKLMDVADVEVRYGAFDALRTLDEADPFLGRVRVLDDPAEAEDESQPDSMSMSMALSLRRRNRPTDPFALYLIDCEGPPMVHIARTRRCEIVLFGRDQRLLTPLVLGNGTILLNASDGDASIQVSKIVTESHGQADADSKVVASLELGDVIHQTANLGAKYPDIVAILQAAERQKNLPGPLVIDAVPGNSPVYIEAAIFGKDTTSKKDDDVKKSKLEEDEKSTGFFSRLRSRFRNK
jgi:flagellar basal body P-ring protein FlgI